MFESRNTDEKNRFDETVHYACISNPTSLRNLLPIRQGEDVKSPDASGMTPLARALARGDIAAVQVLVRAGAVMTVDAATAPPGFKVPHFCIVVGGMFESEANPNPNLTPNHDATSTLESHLCTTQTAHHWSTLQEAVDDSEDDDDEKEEKKKKKKKKTAQVPAAVEGEESPKKKKKA